MYQKETTMSRRTIWIAVLASLVAFWLSFGVLAWAIL